MSVEELLEKRLRGSLDKDEFLERYKPAVVDTITDFFQFRANLRVDKNDPRNISGLARAAEVLRNVGIDPLELIRNRYGDEASFEPPDF